MCKTHWELFSSLGSGAGRRGAAVRSANVSIDMVQRVLELSENGWVRGNRDCIYSMSGHLVFKNSGPLPGGKVVKGAVLQRQLSHQRPWVCAQALSQLAATGRSLGRRTIGLASSGLGRAWPVGISLSHRAPATPVAGRAQCTLTKVARCTVFPPTRWCGWLPGWMRTVLRSSAACLSEGA